MSSVDLLCNGDSSGSATVTTLSGTPPFTYSWNTVPVQTSATATHLAAGNYSVTVTDSVGCSVISTVIVNQPTALAMTVSTADASCSTCNDGYAWALGNGGTPPYSYEWGTNPIQNTDTAYNLLPGSYYVCVDDSNNCKACTTVVVSYSVGIDAAGSGSSGFLLHPNPTHNILNVEMHTLSPLSATELKIYDVMGRMVYEQILNRQSTIINHQFFPGIYFVMVKGGEKVWQQKLVVE
jgi:hypothetical protein